MTEKQKSLNRKKTSVAKRMSSSETLLGSDKIAEQKLRPWGAVSVLEEGTRYKIKRVEVKPGHRLSLQTHQHRSEHWIVVSGTAKVI